MCNLSPKALHELMSSPCATRPRLEQLAPTHEALERERKQVAIERRKQGTQSEKKRPLRNASGRHKRWVADVCSVSKL